MPAHDWTRVHASIFHDFHQAWVVQIRTILNLECLPPEYYALVEPAAERFGLPINLNDVTIYALRRNRVVIRDVADDQIVAFVEVVSPGNKQSATLMKAYVDKPKEAFAAGFHLLVVDVIPPGEHDRLGLHAQFWSEETPAVTPEKPLSLSSYCAGPAPAAYLDPFAVGAELPDMPLFLTTERYINVPLEATYLAAWKGVPQRWKRVLEGG